ncbi:hypothetical protein D3C77_679720 [compost metagenome]
MKITMPVGSNSRIPMIAPALSSTVRVIGRMNTLSMLSSAPWQYSVACTAISSAPTQNTNCPVATCSALQPGASRVRIP